MLAPAQSRESASKRGLASLLCGADRATARCLALREVIGEGLSLVDRLLLGLGVVRVDDGRRGVAGGLAAAETCKSSSRSSSRIREFPISQFRDEILQISGKS